MLEVPITASGISVSAHIEPGSAYILGVPLLRYATLYVLRPGCTHCDSSSRGLPKFEREVRISINEERFNRDRASYVHSTKVAARPESRVIMLITPPALIMVLHFSPLPLLHSLMPKFTFGPDKCVAGSRKEQLTLFFQTKSKYTT